MRVVCSLLLFHLCISFTFAESKIPISVVTECNQPCKTRVEDALPDSLPTNITLALLAITNDKPKIKVLPWARAYNIALNEKNTLIYSISRTEQREPLFQWIGDFEDEKYYAWGLKSTTLNNVNSTFDGLSFATYRGSNEFDYLSKLAKVNLQTVVYPSQRIHMLLAKRVDLFIESEPTLKELCIKLEISCSQFTKVSEIKTLNTPLSIAMNKSSDPDIVKKYQHAFNTLKQTGKLAQIIRDWQENPYE